MAIVEIGTWRWWATIEIYRALMVVNADVGERWADWSGLRRRLLRVLDEQGL